MFNAVHPHAVCALLCWLAAGKWFVRKGQRVDISNVAMQRREDQWGGKFGDPNSYNPDRFMPGGFNPVCQLGWIRSCGFQLDLFYRLGRRVKTCQQLHPD
jgi:hypothetical protein